MRSSKALSLKRKMYCTSKVKTLLLELLAKASKAGQVSLLKNELTSKELRLRCTILLNDLAAVKRANKSTY